MTANQSALIPSFNQLKRQFLESGYEIRRYARQDLERLALSAPTQEKRHLDSQIMGLIMPDRNVIGLAKELKPDQAALTLLHEWIHLFNEDLPEDRVEEITLDFAKTLSPHQMGFLAFLVS